MTRERGDQEGGLDACKKMVDVQRHICLPAREGGGGVDFVRSEIIYTRARTKDRKRETAKPGQSGHTGTRYIIRRYRIGMIINNIAR